eukprot:528805_1
MQLEDAFSFFTQLNDIEREKSRNLLIKICKNILNEPNNEKYRDLNFMKMSKKFAKCTICMELLLSVGFEKSIDGQRLKLNNTTELNKLNTLHNKLTNVTEVTNVTSHNTQQLIFVNSNESEMACNNYKQCKSMTRLLAALTFYSHLNIIKNDKDAEIFRKFMNDIHYQVINDYIHFNNKHT